MPVRSAAMSAVLVKMPPPALANSARELAPKLNAIMTVSYTHLDVYKRQGISREGEAVMAPVRAYVGKYGYARGSAKQPRIVAASLAGDAGINGAALLGTEKK